MVSMCLSVLSVRTYCFQLAFVACFKMSSLDGGPQKVSCLVFEQYPVSLLSLSSIVGWPTLHLKKEAQISNPVVGIWDLETKKLRSP
jgi:hypothetical protein